MPERSDLQGGNDLKFDEIGYWSEIKLEIVKKYAQAYSVILAKNPGLSYAYIDGFAGTGVHLTRDTHEFVPGSPLNALRVKPPFHDYFLVDLDGEKVDQLRGFPEVTRRAEVHVLEGDCNEVLLRDVFPLVRYEDYRRALCLLDPYGLHLNWEVIEMAGKMRSLEIFLNFPIMDINRNALWHELERVSAAGITRMTAFWGDASWRQIAYAENPQLSLFGNTRLQKVSNEEVVAAFRQRLKDVACFKHVPEPMPMRNSTNAVVYYLFFASQRPVAARIVEDIFKKYRNRRG